MNIYDSDGVLSLDAARAAGNALPGANADPKVQAQRLTIAALLDIAESLRPLAAEALAAANGVDLNGTFYGIPRLDPDNNPFEFEVGDVVHVEGIDAPGEIVSFRDTEGETFADVRYSAAGEEKVGVRVPLRSLHRLVGDEGEEPDPLAEVIIDKPAEVTLMDGTQPPKDEDGYPILSAAPDLTDELDEDFDGDAHTAAEDAVAKLAEAEAKRKAEKKGKAKR